MAGSVTANNGEENGSHGSEPVMTAVESEAPAPPPPKPAAAAPGAPIIPDEIIFHKDPDDDTIGFKAMIEGLTCVSSYSAFRQGFRTAAFVLFPMFTIAIHPNTMFRLKFPAMLIASVIGTSTHRGTLGEQLGIHSCALRGYAYMLIWSLIVESNNVVDHLGAWWGLIAVSIFLGFLVAHGILRRFMLIYLFVYMMEIRMYDTYFMQVPVTNGAWFCADLCIGTSIGIAALLFPYPILVKKFVDTIMEKIFGGIGKLCMGMCMFIMSPNPHAATVFYADRTPFAKIEGVLAVMPALLWFSNFEPTEFATRNPIRRLKLSLLRRVLALMYAAFSAGQVIVKLRREQADRVTALGFRKALLKQIRGADKAKKSKNKRSAKRAADEAEDSEEDQPDRLGATFSGVVDIDQDVTSDDDDDKDDGTRSDGSPEKLKVRSQIAVLRANSVEYKKVFCATLMKSIGAVGATDSTPQKILQGVPFDTLREHEMEARRNSRVEVLHVFQQLAVLTQQRRASKEEERQREPYSEVEPSHSPFGDNCTDSRPAGDAPPSGRYVHSDADARTILAMQDTVDENEIFIYLHEVFFAQIMSMIAHELLSFGDMMENYKPSKSLGRRVLEHMLVEPWHDFWEEVWFRLTLARRLDVRVVKDAIRMTCAVLVACAMNFQIFIVQGGLYFFGTTILLGLPVEEESLGITINRITGNTIGCAVGYLCYHNVKNMSEMIGMAVTFCFLFQMFKGHPTYGQAFFYSSIITPAGVATSLQTLELLTRTLASVYAILGFMLVCMLIFPNNTIKILWGSRAKLVKAVSEVLDDVAAAARIPITYGAAPAKSRGDNEEASSSGDGENEKKGGSQRSGDDVVSNETVPYRSVEVETKMAELSVGVDLVKRMLSACNKWTPIAAREPMMRGTQQFPTGASSIITSTHQRMVSSVELIVFGMQLVHRPRLDAPHGALTRALSGSIADFLDDFAGATRLMFQNFIDSLQLSRKWTYPVALSYTSYLMQMKVRLHAIIFEVFAVLSEPLAQGVWQLAPEDFERIRQEIHERRQKEAGASADGTVRVQAGDRAAPQGAAPAKAREGGEGGEDGDYPVEDSSPLPQQQQQQQQLPNASMIDFNASFADRYLGARRELAEGGDHSMTQGDFREGEPVRNVTFAFDSTMRPAHNRPYRHVAPLNEAVAQPLDQFPLTQNDPEDELAETLRRNNEHYEHDRRHHPHGSAAAASRQQSGITGASSSRPPSARDSDEGSDYVPLPVRRQGSVLGRTMDRYKQQEHEEAKLHYMGPLFNYQEDFTELPLDTDLVAIIVILSSCNALMNEIEEMQWAVNFINDYQKQLHESSLIISLIDKISEKVKARRRQIHERYHEPEGSSSLVIPQDIFGNWRF